MALPVMSWKSRGGLNLMGAGRTARLSLLQAGYHIVLTRREDAGHVRALHLMDRWSTGWVLLQSAVKNVDDLAQMEIAR